VSLESTADLVAVNVASSGREEAHAPLRLIAGIFRQIVELIALVLVIANVAVTVSD
jgi:hypothetical protein